MRDNAGVILRHTFNPPHNTRLAHLCGPTDEHLRTIEAGLQVGIAHRHEQFKIDGPKKQAERAMEVLQATPGKQAVAEQEHGASQTQRLCQHRHVLEQLRHARYPKPHQERIAEHTPGYAHADMPACDRLAQHEEVLRTNRRHQCKTNGEAGEPGRSSFSYPHAIA